jgi:GTP-binding protein LepA
VKACCGATSLSQKARKAEKGRKGRVKRIGRVDIPQEAFLAVLKAGEDSQ